jgi:hypothetical protein
MDLDKRKMALLEQQAAQKAGGPPQGMKISPDQRWNPQTQSLEAIPGGKLWQTQKGNRAKDLNTLRTAQSTAEDADKKIQSLLSPDNEEGFNNQFGGYTAMATRYLPGKTQDVGANLESLKQNLKMAGLGFIRAGGSIGQMTEKEWPIVEGLIGTLKPTMSKDAAKNTLMQIRARMQKIKDQAQEIYDSEWANSQFDQEHPQGPKKRYTIESVEP